MTEFDIAIAGFGPVGATAAALLAGRGLRVVVLDPAPEVFDKPRAITADHEVMRILQFAGVAHDLAPLTTPHTGAVYLGADGEEILALDTVEPPYPLGWTPGFHFIQPQMEALLRRAAADRGADIRLGWAVTGFADERDAVRVEAADADGASRTITARYLLACDGAGSFVRRRLGVGHEDLAFDEWWIVVDAWVRRPTPLPTQNTQYCRPARPGSAVLGPQTLRRWELKLLPGETPQMFQDEAAVRAALADFVDVEALEIWRSAVYRFHAIVADDWRRGRTFLLGDAAHQMPPFLGQGLCAGLRDASNLAWKIAAVERDGADPALLDTYQAERQPHVRAVVALAKARGLIIGELDPVAAAARDARLRAMTARGEIETVRHRYIPTLAHGLIARDADGAPARAAGDLFVQPRVRPPGGEAALMDDLLPDAFLVVAADPAVFEGLDAADLARLGALRVVIAPDAAPADGVIALAEEEGVFDRWRRAAGVVAAVVRPDRYLYGAAADGMELRALVRDLAAAMFGEAAA